MSGVDRYLFVSRLQTSARVSLLRVKIENETSQGNFWESRMRMRVLGEKLRVENENESSEGGKWDWNLQWDSKFSRMGVWLRLKVHLLCDYSY